MSEDNNLEDNFKAATARMDRISKSGSDKELYKKYGEPLVILYGYYKVATVGPLNKPKPDILDQKGRKKWDAWNKVTQMNLSQDQAKAYYIKTVLDIIQK